MGAIEVRRALRSPWALAAVFVLAVAVRLAFGVAVGADLRYGVDADYYHSTANSLTSGHGFKVRPADGIWGAGVDPDLRLPATAHPPMHTLVLAGADFVGLDGWGAQRAVLAVVSAVGVLATGLLGRRVGGPMVGLVAALVAALHPLWFQAAGFSSSEATSFAVLPIALLVLHLACERRTVAWALAAGAAAGVATLTRSEAAVLLLGAVVAVALPRPRRRGLALGACTLAAGLLVLAPWLGWMKATTGTFTLSTNAGVTLLGSNCPSAYEGPRLGSFGSDCVIEYSAGITLAAPQDVDDGHRAGWVDDEMRSAGIDEALSHKRRLPVVALARVGRTAGVYRIDESIVFDRGIGSEPSYQRVGYIVNWVLLAAAVYGGVVVARRRRWADGATFAAALAVAVAAGVGVYGATRMRISLEPVLAILAAQAAVTVARRLVGRRPPASAT